MTRLYDFVYPIALQDLAQDSYSSFWGVIQNFAINTDSSLKDVLEMPYWILDDYYETEAWNIRKELVKENAKIHTNYADILNNIVTALGNLARRWNR